MAGNIWTNQYNPFNSFKVLAWYNNLKAIKSGHFLPPINIALDLCQGTQEHKLCGGFNCKMCMSNYEPLGKVCKIPVDVLMTLPQFFSEWGVLSLCLAGHNSDPCSYNHADLIKFLRLCKQYNIDIGFVSNGALYTESLMEEIARNCNWSGWSVNAGNENDHQAITGTKPGTFTKIMANMKKMSGIIKDKNLEHDIGYKFLIMPENYKNILEAIENAKANGARHVQIRPCNLDKEQSDLINPEEVERQIKESLKLEVPGQFEIFGIREKFKPDFTKRVPRRCIASPLGSTWKASGEVCICPDSRWTTHQPGRVLGNFLEEGLEEIRRKWGSKEHRAMIKAANDNIENCIRCTAYSWHDIYENCIEKDLLDITLI